MAIKMDIHSDLAIPPGEYLEEVIEDLGMTKDELAKRMGRPASKLSPIFKGDKAITPDTALQLEKVVKVPAHIWTDLEAEYRLTLARQAEKREDENLKEESKMTTKFCYCELAKLGLVKASLIGKERVQELHHFLGVTSLLNVQKVNRYGLAFRQATSVEKQASKEALTAWLRIGELKAQSERCETFRKESLARALNEIRSMTAQYPDKFMPRLEKLLAQCGIVLVLCPHFPKTYVHGATFWIGKEKAVLMMTIRGKWSDIFWFSLIHECGHLLLHGPREVFLEFDDGSPEHIKQEEEANSYAANLLIPQKCYQNFVSRGYFTADAIRLFSKEINIHPGIVVGRLHNDKYLEHYMQNELRIQYEWNFAAGWPNAFFHPIAPTKVAGAIDHFSS